MEIGNSIHTTPDCFYLSLVGKSSEKMRFQNTLRSSAQRVQDRIIVPLYAETFNNFYWDDKRFTVKAHVDTRVTFLNLGAGRWHTWLSAGIIMHKGLGSSSQATSSAEKLHK